MTKSYTCKLEKWFNDQKCDSMQICIMFEHLSGISLFIKDVNYRLLHISKHFLPRLGLSSNEELFGKTDFDLFPPRLAEHFRRDDTTVMESKEPMLNILELVFNSQGLPDWYLTNKYPLLNRNQEVVGIIGTVRPYVEAHHPVHNSDLKWERDDEIGRVVTYIRENFRNNLGIERLLEVSGLDHRKLHRCFVELFGVSPMQFIIRTRLEAACDDLLTSKKKISQIAKENGFYDQSSFTQLFRRVMKITPLKYRKQRAFT